MTDLTDLIELRGLRVVGRHGVLDEERARAQPFEVDLELEVDLRRAGRTDALSDTVDYGAVAEAVAAVVGGEHSDLLEHLADRIARAVMAATGPSERAVVDAVTVTIRKLRPPVPVDLAWAAVRIRRHRDELAGTDCPGHGASGA
ncbi:MAG: dihydroneopterin aldolase [Actinomycetota bacterium]|nr:dihydroneopterin aldolase [Actinomycetota bacterium]